MSRRVLIAGMVIAVLGFYLCGCNGDGNGNGGDTKPPVTEADPEGDTYNDPVSVKLESNESASIYYTLDGREPTTADYDGAGPSPISGITISVPTTLKFFAIDTAGNQETVKTEVYNILSGVLEIKTTSLPVGVLNETYSATLEAQGGTPPYAWSITNGALPDGLALVANGTITGTPTAEGQTAFTVQVTDNSNPQQTATADLSITIAAGGLEITTTELPEGVAEETYPTTTLEATGGTTPYTWSWSGNTPPGMDLSTDGVISGTPTANADFLLTVTVTDNIGLAAKKDFTIRILAAGSITISTPPTLPSGVVDVAYTKTLEAAGGTGAYTWSISSGDLPDGLDLATDGTISGTPTTEGDSTFTIKAQDTAPSPAEAEQAFTLSIIPVPPEITTTALPSGEDGKPYSETLQATGGTLPLEWSISAGSLPSGLSINSSTGTISGTPDTVDTYTFTVKVADDESPPRTDTREFTIRIDIATTEVELAGGDGDAQDIPVHLEWPLDGEVKYSRCQMIYHQTLIEDNGGGAGKIVKIKFSKASGGACTFKNVKLYMNHTAVTKYFGFDWLDEEGTLVFEGDVDVPEGDEGAAMVEIPLDTPFQYSNETGQNLLVSIYHTTEDITPTEIIWNGIAGMPLRAAIGSSNETNPPEPESWLKRPNIVLYIQLQ